MSFGFSIGDFLAVGRLIKDISDCLRDQKGSQAEYQELRRELDGLQLALQHLDELPADSSQSSHLESIKYAALCCRHPLEQFLHKIRKYDNSLGVWRSGNAMKRTTDKLRWSINQKEEIRKLQNYISFHVGTINILLAEHGLKTLTIASEKAAISQTDIQERLAQTQDIVKQCAGSVTAQTAVVHSTHGMVARLCKIVSGELTSSWKGLEEMVAKVCVSTQQVYTLLHEIKASLMGPDTRWTFFQAPLLVEDALGHRFPVPSEYDFDLLDAVVKHKFNNGPGSMEVLNGNYEYVKTKDSSIILCRASRLLPGMEITMAIVFARPDSTSEICPISSCNSTDTTDAKHGGKTCLKCNAWFSSTNRKYKLLNECSPQDPAPVFEPSDAAENRCAQIAIPRKRKASVLMDDHDTEFKNLRLFCFGGTERVHNEHIEHPVSIDSGSYISKDLGLDINPLSNGESHHRDLEYYSSMNKSWYWTSDMGGEDPLQFYAAQHADLFYKMIASNRPELSSQPFEDGANKRRRSWSHSGAKRQHVRTA